MMADSLWQRWGDLTRYLNSARIAFAREARLWNDLEIKHPKDTRLHSSVGQSAYEVRLDQHRDAVGSEETLCATVLIASYALAESASVARLNLGEHATGGIEAWGGNLLKANGRVWDDVLDGQAGAVEVAVVRNFYAHASVALDQRELSRLRQVQSDRFALGDVPQLDYETTVLYRDRLRSLLRNGAIRDVS